MGDYDSEETSGVDGASIRWILGGLSGVAALVVTLLIAVQTSIDDRQNDQLERLSLDIPQMQRDIAVIAESLVHLNKALEKMSGKIDLLDQFGSTYSKKQFDRFMSDKENAQ